MSAMLRILGMVLGLCVCATLPAVPMSAATRATVLGAPLRFEPNRGQSDARVRFLARGTGYGMFLTDDEAVLRLALANAGDADPQLAVVRMRLDGARPARPRGRLLQGGRSNYLSVDARRPAISGLPHYSELVYRGRYPGIDLVYYGHDGELEYDFVLAAGADPAQIALRFDGADEVRVAANGDLHIELGGRTLVQRAPLAFQYADSASVIDATRLRHSDGARIRVESRYRVDADGAVRFELGAYERTRPLVIDPVFAYSTCLGGSDFDAVEDLALGAGGETWVVGHTSSPDFPLVGQIQGFGGNTDLFVTKLNAAGSAAIYSTYVAGTVDHQVGLGIAVNAAGEAHVAGFKQSTSSGAIQALLIKLNAAGNALVFADYFGGNGATRANEVAFDSSGNIIVVGSTSSSNFPVLNALQGTSGGGDDAFVRRYSPTGSVLSSSYLGGANDQRANALAIGVNNAIYIAGETAVTDPSGDAFVVKLNASATSAVWIKLLTGSGRDFAEDIVVDGGSRAHVVGHTESANFPVANALDATYGGSGDGFLTVIDSGGVTLLTSTFLGDANSETAYGVALGPSGDIYITGGKTGGNYAPFLMRLAASFNTAVYSLQLGWSSYEGAGVAVRVDNAGAAYVVGRSNSGEYFPSTAGAFQACANTLGNGFVAKIVDGTALLSIADAAMVEGSTNADMHFTVSLSAAPVEDISFNVAAVNGSALANVDYFPPGGSGWIAAGDRTGQIDVTLAGDLLDEPDETFYVNLSGVAGAGAGDLQAQGTILDDDAAPVLSVDGGGCTLTEGNSGSSNCNFVARLSVASGRTVNFNSATANGGASAGSDYTAHASTARSIAAGQTALTIAVPVLGDTLDEDNETFALNLTGVANATPGTLAGTGTITDDDAAPTLSIDNGGCSVTEGNSGTINCSFVARLSAVSGRAVSFTSATANGTASAGSDYTAHSGIGRTLNPGLQTLTVLVPVIGDTVDEPNETFALNLTGISNATPASLSGTGTIVDDDAPAATGALRVRDATVLVGENSGNAQIVVERVGGSSGAASVHYASANGTAVAGLDYGAASGTLNWAAGDAGAKTITLTIIFDPAPEPQESFTLNLSQASGATLGTPATSTISIVDGTQMLHANGFE